MPQFMRSFGKYDKNWMDLNRSVCHHKNSGYHNNIHYLVNANSFAVLREGTLQQFDTEVCEDPLYLYLQNYVARSSGSTQTSRRAGAA